MEKANKSRLVESVMDYDFVLAEHEIEMESVEDVSESDLKTSLRRVAITLIRRCSSDIAR